MARPGKRMFDLLQACRRSKFLDFSLDNTTILRDLRLTSVGQLLSDNLHAEWNQRGSCSSSVPVFIGKSNLTLKENIAKVQRQTKVTKLPIGITMEQRRTNQQVMIGNGFTLELPKALELCTSYLLPSTMANQFLYLLQRQCKIWWMRLSNDPGRYFISDMRLNENTNQMTSVSIYARFLDRSEHMTEVELEQLDVSLNSEFAGTSTAIVRVSNNLNRSTLAFLMDALESAPLEKCVKINRKIAPFKCGIVCQIEDKYAQDTGVQQELAELSKHLTYVLRGAKLSSLDGSFDQEPHHHQFTQLDQIGVPYVLLLNTQTLQTGLLQLRSRDTTLCETIHVSDLPCYLTKIIYA